MVLTRDEVDVSTTIANVKFPGCILNASGPVCASLEELTALFESESGGVLTKSCTVEPRDGNELPRGGFLPFGSIQSMGLPNLGYSKYIEMAPLLKERFPHKPIVVSVAGLCSDDNRKMIPEIYEARPDLVELNLSCPNIVGKPQLAYDFEATDELLRSLSEAETVPLGLKLPPFFDQSHVDSIADVIKKYPLVKFLTCVNSVGNTLAIDPVSETSVIRPKGGFGGLSGQYIKPIGLANVKAFRDRFSSDRLDLIGVGGIMNGTDIFEYLLAGASAVQVGTCLWMEGTRCFGRLEAELKDVMRHKGYQSLAAFVGKLKLPPAAAVDETTKSQAPMPPFVSAENVVCTNLGSTAEIKADVKNFM